MYYTTLENIKEMLSDRQDIIRVEYLTGGKWIRAYLKDNISITFRNW